MATKQESHPLKWPDGSAHSVKTYTQQEVECLLAAFKERACSVTCDYCRRGDIPSPQTDQNWRKGEQQWWHGDHDNEFSVRCRAEPIRLAWYGPCEHALITRAEAEQMAKAQVAAFKERAAGVLRSILIEHHLSDTAQASIIGDFRDDVRLPVDDSALREHDAALLKRFEQAK